MNPKRLKINPMYFQPIESIKNERYRYHKTKEAKNGYVSEKREKGRLQSD